MKTTLQWLNLLPEPYRKQAIKNYTDHKTKLELKQQKEYSKRDVTSIKEALLGAFDWSNSSEGLDYWIEASKLQLVEQ